jgi:trimeric autotransporter adhesin
MKGLPGWKIGKTGANPMIQFLIRITITASRFMRKVKNDRIFGLPGSVPALFSLLIFSAKSAIPGNPMLPDANWVSMNPYFMDGTIQSLVWVKSNLYVSGNFHHIAGIEANNIAQWDGQMWKPLGTGVNGAIETMISDAMGAIYVGGAFDSAGGNAALNCALWNGQGWSALGKGVSGKVWDMVFDKNGNLYAGGNFKRAGDDTTALNVACWNGSLWTGLKTGGPNISMFPGVWEVYCLAVDSSNNLYMGGYAYNRVTCSICTDPFAKMWNSTGWSNIYSGQGTESGRIWPVVSIDVDHAGKVYLSGADFRMRGPQDTAWTIIKKGWFRRILGIDDSNNVFTEKDTQFYFNSYISYYMVEKWNGVSMSTFGDSASDIHSITFDPLGNMYAGGDFISVGGAAAQNLAMRNKQKWGALTPGCIDSIVYRCMVDQKGALHILGEFASVNNDPQIATHAKYNGGVWSALPGGPKPSEAEDPFIFDSYGNLYCLARTNSIVKWDGSGWTTIAECKNLFKSIAFDAQDNLYAVGNFDTISTPGGGKYAVSKVARWDGKTWTSMGDGLERAVHCIATGLSGELYIVERGNPDTGRYIKKWNGGSWSTIGTFAGDTYLYPSQLVVDRYGAVYFCGSVDSINGSPCSYAKWDGQKWTCLNPRKRAKYLCQTTDDAGNIYVAGQFDSIGTIAARQIARWNGREWRAIGSGAKRQDIRSIAYDSASQRLYVCGGFSSIGNTYSPYLAAYNFSKINPVHRPGVSRSAPVFPRWRLIKSTLVISDVLPHDRISFYSVSGRCVQRADGGAKLDLGGLAPGPLFVHIQRGKKIVLRGVVMKQ